MADSPLDRGMGCLGSRRAQAIVALSPAVAGASFFFSGLSYNGWVLSRSCSYELAIVAIFVNLCYFALTLPFTYWMALSVTDEWISALAFDRGVTSKVRARASPLRRLLSKHSNQSFGLIVTLLLGVLYLAIALACVLGPFSPGACKPSCVPLVYNGANQDGSLILEISNTYHCAANRVLVTSDQCYITNFGGPFFELHAKDEHPEQCKLSIACGLNTWIATCPIVTDAARSQRIAKRYQYQDRELPGTSPLRLTTILSFLALLLPWSMVVYWDRRLNRAVEELGTTTRYYDWLSPLYLFGVRDVLLKYVPPDQQVNDDNHNQDDDGEDD